MVKANATELTAMIEQLAYFKSESRGFVPGDELADWLEAEAEIITALSRAKPKKRVQTKSTTTRSKKSGAVTA